MIEGDQTTVTVTVDVEPAVALEVVTQEVDLWWRRNIAYRVAGRKPGMLVLEGKVGGRLFEQYEGPAGPAVHESGRITAWEPPPAGAADARGRLGFDWR